MPNYPTSWKRKMIISIEDIEEERQLFDHDFRGIYYGDEEVEEALKEMDALGYMDNPDFWIRVFELNERSVMGLYDKKKKDEEKETVSE